MPITAVRHRNYRNETLTSTPEDLLAQAKNDPVFPVPFPFLNSMLNPEARPDHNPLHVSVTHVLKGCTSCKILQANEDYTVDLADLFAAWRGTQYHSLLESHAAPGDVVERRFWAKVPGTQYVIHGKPDLIRPWPVSEDGSGDGLGTIIDLKTTQSIPNWDTPWADHCEQVFDYTWLVRHSYEHETGDGNVAGGAEGLPFNPREFRFVNAVIWYMGDVQGRLVFKPLEIRRKVQVATKAGAKYPTRSEKEPYILSDEEIEAKLFPKVIEHCEAMLEYADSGTLPPYPRGFDYIGGFAHRYSPTAHECVRRHILDGSLDKPSALFLVA